MGLTYQTYLFLIKSHGSLQDQIDAGPMPWQVAVSYVQAAAETIAAANPNDRLLIEGGVTFTENLSINKKLTLSVG